MTLFCKYFSPVICDEQGLQRAGTTTNNFRKTEVSKFKSVNVFPFVTVESGV